MFHAKKTAARRRKPGKGRSVFRTIMVPLLALVLVEALLLTAVLLASGVVTQLDQNAEEILGEQVQNRANYLASTFSGWADLQHLSDLVDDKTQAMLDSGALTLEQLSTDPAACSPLLIDLTDDLISTLYSKRLTGVYVIFNTQDLSELEDGQGVGKRVGLYLRDMDPTSPPSVRNEDLLWERCPVSVVQALDISTDTAWRPQFDFPDGEGPENRAFFVEPMRAVFSAERVSDGDAEDYGYWGAVSTPLLDSNRPAITYSIPLILPDGTVYGVLGIGVLVNYLETMLPHGELYDSQSAGSYLMAVNDGKAIRVAEDNAWNVTPMLLAGRTTQTYQLDRTIALQPRRSGHTYVSPDGTRFYLSHASIPLYSANTPFDGQEWVLLGAVPTRTLYAFSLRMMLLLIADIILMVVVGAAGSLIVSRRLSRPIHALADEVEQAGAASGRSIPHLSETGIAEIDRFSGAITSLSQDVVNASTRFLQIIDLASVELGGFEVREDERSVFVTDNFFAMLGLPGIDTTDLSTGEFWEILHRMDDSPSAQHTADGSVLYKIELPPAPTRYIRVDITQTANSKVGVAEDVTGATLERLRAERERDYDLLTGLLSRRAFQAKAEEIFRSPGTLGHAALMMLDLDNLKFFNDHYGHDCGDAYIRKAGECFALNVPAGTLCSRVSGDEFFLLFYGYASREALRQVIDDFAQAMRENSFRPAGGGPVPVSASGGVAWYPDDATDLHTLMKYADFAMYQVKREHKGQLGEFDLGAYSRESFMDQSKEEFLELVRGEEVFFHFQPIVSAATGEVFAYEALMRTDLPALHSPEAILRMARETGQLKDVESLTWLKAPQCFRQLLDSGKAAPGAYLFVNSIASQYMPHRTIERFRKESGDLQPRMVVEITDAGSLTAEALQIKRDAPYLSGLFALDDYGKGDNDDRAMAALVPQFVKIDVTVIHDIDSNPEHQKLVSDLVTRAHAKHIRVIAEGVETMAQLDAVLRFGVDLLQGFLIARPAPVPEPVAPAVLERLRPQA